MQQRTITFDPVPHTYTDEHNKQYTSVTTLIGKVEPEYPAEFWAMYRAIDQMGIYRPRPFVESNSIEVLFYGKRKKFTIPTLYSGILQLDKTPAEITAEWKAQTEEACDWGSAKHDYLENCINQFATTNHIPVHEIYSNSNTRGFAYRVSNIAELEASPLRLMYPTIYAAIEQKVRAGWVVYAEKRIYSSIHYVAGTIDLLFVKKGKFIILDWKTNKDKLKWTPGYFKKKWNADRSKKIKTKQWIKRNDTFKFPLNKLPYCKGNTYTLQLSLYAYLAELWGLKCAGIVLCQIRPYIDANDEIVYLEDGITRKEHEPEFHKIAYKKAEVKRLLDWHTGEILRFKQPELSL